MWAYESVFYQIYPLGFCGAPFENDGCGSQQNPESDRLDPAHQKAGGKCDLFFAGV